MTFPATVLAVLVYVQAHLDEQLDTPTLAGRVGLSPRQLHRLFLQVTGETVKQYTQRLRLERAAYRLIVEDATVLRVAVDCGYHSHETFTRAFRRRFGTTPSAYRAAPPVGRPPGERRPGLEEALPTGELSATRVRELGPVHVVFRRFVGPYGEVDPDAWAALQRWAHAKGLPSDGALLGVGHDAPGVTAPERLRFDACLAVPEPVRPGGRVGYQLIDGGLFACTTYVGPFHGLGDAYDRIVPATARLAGRRLIGLPAVEQYGRTVVAGADALNTTEIRLPVA